MRRRMYLTTALALAAAPALGQSDESPGRDAVTSAMKEATRFMVEEVATNGGYVWSYLPDMSKCWGEMEAYDSMVWVQPPGTATMGHVFLDAYHATGDAYYYDAAMEVARALLWGQTEAGGWGYMFDFDGPASLRRWFETIGEAGWRLEEFHHNWGNATFDDAGTAESTQFLLRLYAEKLDPAILPPLERAIDLIVDSQQPWGTWPQRYPENDLWEGDYTSYPTLNDDVASENVETLIMATKVLGRTDLRGTILRGMNAFLLLQQGPDQPGFSLQYDHELAPVEARSYEPLALATHTTASALAQMMDFYELTGDTKFLARIEEGIDWLASLQLPEDQAAEDGDRWPTFIEIGTDRPIYVHRHGANSGSGEYYWNYSDVATLGHYSGKRDVDIEGLRERLATLMDSDPAQVAADSPLEGGDVSLPRFFTLADISTSDLNSNPPPETVEAADVTALLSGLDGQGYWPTELRATSRPYIGPAPNTSDEAPDTYATTRVGDAYDTSPYITDDPVTGISTAAYIENMGTLIRWIAN